MVSEALGICGQVCAVLEDVRPYGAGDKIHKSRCSWWKTEVAKDCDCGRIQVHITRNIITNAGDIYYAERMAAETPTDTFAQMTVATAVAWVPDKTADAGDVTTVPTGGTQNIDGTYPQTNDSDANNPGTTGTDIVTWRRTYTTSQANGTLIGVCINESGATFGSGSDPLLMAATISITKTSAQQLFLYVNHEASGV